MSRSKTVLCVDDDLGDLQLLRAAFGEAGTGVNVLTLSHCGDVYDYLSGVHPFEGLPFPDIILLDLNMQPDNGRETLAGIKSDPRYRHIPVIILSASSDPADIALAYERGANSYVRKPDSFSGLVTLAGILAVYWFDVCELPPHSL